jgi:hypothetical protein
VTAGGFSQQNGSRVLFYKCNGVPLSGLGASWTHDDPYSNLPQSAYTNSHEVFFVDCQLLGDGTQASYACAGSGSRLVFLNTYIGGTASGTFRLGAWDRGVMRHSRVEAPYSDTNVHAIKVHSGGSNAYDDNWLASGGKNPTTLAYANWMTSKLVFANNYFGGGNNGTASANWTVAISPQNDGFGQAGVEPLVDVILENNIFVHIAGRMGGLDIAWRGKRMTSRGNTVSGSGALAIGLGHQQPVDFDGPYFTD